MVVGLGIRQSDASELTPTIWALIDCRSDPPGLNLLGVGPDEFESECMVTVANRNTEYLLYITLRKYPLSPTYRQQMPSSLQTESVYYT
ncbi:hypothetical protein PtA15_3A296 [Puccinia triticina]|uniref:Uncharacterized protein n=1 Tax=Puccinia triticina TaxID=208348 RepID=A0ABY7CFK6_9BASI|nr:uncharacterized protein PtA15_3A296 [Puccinia triticina]WAQ82931.1 hypothetical protein PtA15_3A296 [Puccinia triticina]